MLCTVSDAAFVFFCSIDATHNDGLGRMVNDECRKPNAVMKKKIFSKKLTLCLFALRDICIGEEIRYDYGPDDGRMHWRSVQLKKINKTSKDANAVTAIEHEAVAYVPCDKADKFRYLHIANAFSHHLDHSHNECESTLVTDAAAFVEPACVDHEAVPYVPFDKAEVAVDTHTVAPLVECESTLVTDTAAAFVEPACVDHEAVPYVPFDKAEVAVDTDTVAPFLKFEDENSCFRPCFVQFESAPSVDLHGNIRSGIFTAVHTRRKPTREALRYCECCDTQYTDLSKHLRSFRHRMFVITDSNYTKLDSLIGEIHCESSSVCDSRANCSEERQSENAFLETAAKIVKLVDYSDSDMSSSVVHSVVRWFNVFFYF